MLDVQEIMNLSWKLTNTNRIQKVGIGVWDIVRVIFVGANDLKRKEN